MFGDYKYGNREFNNQIKWKEGINYQLLHSYELIVPEGTGELSGLHIIDPVPEAFHQVQKNWNLEFSGLLIRKLLIQKLLISRILIPRLSIKLLLVRIREK